MNSGITFILSSYRARIIDWYVGQDRRCSITLPEVMETTELAPLCQKVQVSEYEMQKLLVYIAAARGLHRMI